MKYELVRNLVGDEVLAKPVCDELGKILLAKGTKLTRRYINQLKQNMIYFVYIENNEINHEDEDVSKVRSSNKINELKDSIFQQLPNIFNDIMNEDQTKLEQSFKSISNFVESIVVENDININLFEIKKYDTYTYIHCIDTGIMSIILGKAIGMNSIELTQLGIGAILHDIGKLKIDNRIINKTGKLTKEEYDQIKMHPIYGYNILKKAGIGDRIILSAVLNHHERVDGKGYPFGLKRDELSNYAKIISICDVFTAISADRSYRERFNPNEAYEYIVGGINTYFDKEIVEIFKKTFFIYPIGCHIRLSNGIEGVVDRQNLGFPDRPVIRIYKSINDSSKALHSEVNLLEYTNLTITNVIRSA